MFCLLRQRILLFQANMAKVHVTESLPRFNSNGTYNYEAAIDALNTLQSNAEYLRKSRALKPEDNTHATLRRNCIEKMLSFLRRSNIAINALKSVIHVAGTKGKGSTCAYCESILRRHGYKTGFFSSPHLINATERIRINGVPVGNQQFASAFWDIYTDLTQSDDKDMPIYFQMLVLMACKLFAQENVDVAILEVGIGGEYDSTNFLNRVEVVGITSLGLDHTSILGGTIEQIAWHKAGIMKPSAQAFTSRQDAAAMQVLQQRSAQIKCPLEVVASDASVTAAVRNPRVTTVPEGIYEMNASLATRLAKCWLENGHRAAFDAQLAQQAIDACDWPGRFQILKLTTSSTFFLDGAHTLESIRFCTQWFLDCTSASCAGGQQRALIFNSTGDRDVVHHLQILHQCGFARVYFVPNVSRTSLNLDNINHNCPASEQLAKCGAIRTKWCSLFPPAADGANVLVMPSVNDAIEHLALEGGIYSVLVTGSLHLVGCALQTLQMLASKPSAITATG